MLFNNLFKFYIWQPEFLDILTFHGLQNFRSIDKL